MFVKREDSKRSDNNVKNEPSRATSKGEFVDTVLCGCGSVRFGSTPTSRHSSVVRPRDRHTKHEEPRTVISRHITMTSP
ncbi:hypothetical protein HanRHA438_Chr06g0284451 [Helianthus annuus]|nr:hypothetical protein HanRHA438_Chr06g0284451 [Helianthus annuus]